MSGVIDQGSAASKFKQWDAFLHRSTGDAEKVLAAGLGESTTAFGIVGGDRGCCPIELVD